MKIAMILNTESSLLLWQWSIWEDQILCVWDLCMCCSHLSMCCVLPYAGVCSFEPVCVVSTPLLAHCSRLAPGSGFGSSAKTALL